jgi:transcriptional regulator with XRE-family HTH domain
MPSFTHDVTYRAFLTHLKAMRRDRGVSQVELAALLGVTQSFVSKAERGERRIDVVEFMAFCDVLQLNPAAEMLKLTEKLRRSSS